MLVRFGFSCFLASSRDLAMFKYVLNCFTCDFDVVIDCFPRGEECLRIVLRLYISDSFIDFENVVIYVSL